MAFSFSRPACSPMERPTHYRTSARAAFNKFGHFNKSSVCFFMFHMETGHFDANFSVLVHNFNTSHPPIIFEMQRKKIPQPIMLEGMRATVVHMARDAAGELRAVACIYWVGRADYRTRFCAVFFPVASRTVDLLWCAKNSRDNSALQNRNVCLFYYLIKAYGRNWFLLWADFWIARWLRSSTQSRISA